MTPATAFGPRASRPHPMSGRDARGPSHHPLCLTLALVGLLVATPSAFGLSLSPATVVADGLTDEDILSRTESAFALGTQHRDDADAAREWFRAAARGYDELWRRGRHNPALALARARAHRLGGDLPAGLAALHEGLAVARYDRPLRVELEDARSAVAYPHDGDLAAQCRPTPPGGIGTRMSPAEAYLAAGLLWLLASLGVARFAMTRAPVWLGFTGVGVVCLAVLGGLWCQDWRRQTAAEARPVVIVTADAMLKAGNGDSWTDRLNARLPRGVEARELSRRGGWVQVELAGGAVGWLPETAVMSVTR